MKVVIVNKSERIGGAAVAANHLMKALRKISVDAKMLVLDKQTEDCNVASLNMNWVEGKKSLFRFIWERLIIFVGNGFRRDQVFRVSIANTGVDISKHPYIKDADVIHLHWINSGLLSLNDLQKLVNLGKPIVWTMHDMWVCTGICHHARDCENFMDACGNCFYLNSNTLNDLSNRTLMKKKRIIESANITLVCCSKWLQEKARKSSIGHTIKVLSIPNPLDQNVFKPLMRGKALRRFNFPKNNIFILFGALNITDERKGLSYLLEGLSLIKHLDPSVYGKIQLVVLGNVKEEIVNLIQIPIVPIGYLNDEHDICQLYNAVDLFVTTSLDENLPNTIMEAMSCGIPCVGFDTGGIAEMIDHKNNGYVVENRSVDDLAEGILWVINNPEKIDFKSNAREKVTTHYNEELVATNYMNEYLQLIK